MTDWQPMETAPLDGTPFLGILSGGEMVVISCGHGELGFVVHASGDEINPLYFTHWMPLPEPPK
jgi:hypothetical protein